MKTLAVTFLIALVLTKMEVTTYGATFPNGHVNKMSTLSLQTVHLS